MVAINSTMVGTVAFKTRPQRPPARVMMVNLGYPPNTVGGTEVLVQSLARALASKGSSISVVSLSTNGTDWTANDKGVHAYFAAAHPMGIALLDPRRTLVKKVLWHALGELNIWSARKLAAALDREKPDIVHTHSLLGLSTNLWRVARKRGIPVVHTLHDYQLLCPRGTMFRAGLPCRGQCETCRWLTLRRRRASILPNAVVGVSESILRAHRIEGYFPHAATHVIPNGIDPSGSDEMRPQRGANYPWRIGLIGRLHPIKGAGLFIDALKELPERSYIAKIAGTGDADYEAQLRERARGFAIDFLGWVRPEKFYAQIDVLVVPSLYSEPQGLVLLEAARMGIPVIYSNRGGLAEMGAAFPDFIAFDPSTPGDLSSALRALIATPPSGFVGSRPLPPRFSRETFVSSYRHLYEGLRVRAIAS